jgi:hypothetical protein
MKFTIYNDFTGMSFEIDIENVEINKKRKLIIFDMNEKNYSEYWPFPSAHESNILNHCDTDDLFPELEELPQPFYDIFPLYQIEDALIKYLDEH